ncbi:MAG: hypothetical protein R6W77_09450 [Trueperaceae bacterium]
MRRVLLVVLSFPLLLTQMALAQNVAGRAFDGVPYVDVASLALRLGVVTTALDDVLTWRGGAGVATFFRGSADALVQAPGDGGPSEHALSAPALVQDGRWFLPLDAAPLLGLDAAVDAAGARLELPDGRVLVLDLSVTSASAEATGDAGPRDDRSEPSVPSGGAGGTDTGEPTWERTEIGPNVPALRFFVGDTVSLLLLDLDLAPLAFPSMTATIDAAAEAAGADHALLLIVNALEPASWETTLRFTQDGRTLEARHPYRLRLHVGAAGTVSPAAPVAGVALLPTTFSLYRPLEVEWAGAKATITFRR